jgi:RNA 3'-terminal phosphate cyclase (ATP)
METVFVDGSVGEGGGQILRTSLALSCITGKSVHIENIRAARRNPGLAKQHLASVHAACQICGAQDSGAVIGSKVLDFHPGTAQAGRYHFDIGSAGSASLVIQTVLPALFLAGKSSTVTVTGGTHNPWAPPYDFLCESFLPAVAAAGFQAACRLIKHGFFPAGGGEITFDIKPWLAATSCDMSRSGKREEQNQIINLYEPFKNSQIYARIYIANLPAHIAQRQERLLLRSKLDIQNIEHFEVADSVGPGNCVMIRLCSDSRITVFTAFGMKGKPSEEVISEVVKLATDFLESGASVDRFLSDQLLIYLALSRTGCFTTNEITSHFQTNVEIIKKFLPVEFNIDQQGKLYRISCVPA